jgi:fibro-slime domain-containing protein
MIVDPDVLNPSNNQCDNVLQVVIRDFSESHVDFERAHPGWGPATGMIEKVLGAGKKPVFANLQGEYQMIDYNCYTECPDGGIAENAELKETGDSYGDTPMWESAGSFAQWYEDVDGVNMHIEKAIVLAEQNDGSYLFDSSEFFPLGVDEGFGESPSGSGKNFLFTTEIHLQFPYEGGEVFTFRGDDDLWIFVNNRLAIDLGGLHWPFESTINFDSMAATLGIEPGKSYDMDIFHAERHTTESNFRIETNIGCFQNIQID